MHQLTLRIVLASLLIGLVPPGGALAQAAPAPTGPQRHLQTHFEVIDAPEQFEQVLQIVDFPADSGWTRPHTPGGYVYTTVIDGAVSTRSANGTGGIDEATFEAGQSFVERPGDYMQVRNVSAGKTRIMATALLPKRAPLTIYENGTTSGAYPTLTQWSSTHNETVTAPGPVTVYRSSMEVDRPGGTLELVQRVLDVAAPTALVVPEWAQIAAMYGVPADASPSGDEARESCLTAWGRVSTGVVSGADEYLYLVEAYRHDFQRVAANLCVSSAYASHSRLDETR